MTETTFLFSSGTGSMGWITDGAPMVEAPEPHTYRNQGVLGHIENNTMDIKRILELDLEGEAAEVIDILLSVEAFESRLLEEFSPLMRISRFMAQHRSALEESGVTAVQKERDFGTNYMPVFTVPKKDETLRFIQDCRHLNRHFMKPPPMHLPRIHDVIDHMMTNEFFAVCDARSMFYQIPLCPDTYKYFGLILGGGRGRLEHAVMTKLPMGFSWAPAIAQRISNVLMRGVGLAWVDNYCLTGKTLTEFEEHRHIFLQRIAKDGGCNVVVDDTELKPMMQGETLGIEFDLAAKRYRMSEKWSTKIRETVVPEDWTARTYSQIMGNVIWCSHVIKRGLCHQPHAMAVLGEIMRMISNKEIKWDECCTRKVTPTAVEELRKLMALMGENPWIQWSAPSAHDVEIWSDASDTHAAYLIVQQQKVIAALVRETRGEHIFLEELSIALDAIEEASRIGARKAKLFIDNAPAGGAIDKNVSTNFTANVRLAKRSTLPVDTRWVSTKQQLADPYTRGRPVPISRPAGSDSIRIRIGIGSESARIRIGIGFGSESDRNRIGFDSGSDSDSIRVRPI